MFQKKKKNVFKEYLYNEKKGSTERHGFTVKENKGKKKLKAT